MTLTASLTSVADLPQFTCLNSYILRRLPVALFVLACRKLAEVSNASVIGVAVPVFCIHARTPLTDPRIRVADSYFCIT